jgi:hypothetical protein
MSRKLNTLNTLQFDKSTHFKRRNTRINFPYPTRLVVQRWVSVSPWVEVQPVVLVCVDLHICLFHNFRDRNSYPSRQDFWRNISKFNDKAARVWNLQYPDIHRILKFGFGYQTVKWLISQLNTKKISNIRKMLKWQSPDGFWILWVCHPSLSSCYVHFCVLMNCLVVDCWISCCYCNVRVKSNRDQPPPPRATPKHLT